MSNSQTPIFATILFAVLLSACGGGGNSESVQAAATKAPAPIIALDIEVTATSLKLDEGDTGSIGITTKYNGNKALTYSISVAGSNYLQASVSADQINLVAGLVANLNESAELTLTVTDGTLTDSETIVVDIYNHSFWQMHSGLIDKAEAMLQFAQNDTSASNAIIFFTDIDYRAGIIGKETFESLIVTRIDMVVAFNTRLANDLQNVINALSAFSSSSDGNESDLEEIMSQIDTSSVKYAQDISNTFKESDSVNGNILPNITVSALNETNGSYSLFIGDSLFGAQSNDGWHFNADYKFLEAVLASNACYAI